MFSSNYADDNVFSLNGIELEHMAIINQTNQEHFWDYTWTKTFT